MSQAIVISSLVFCAAALIIADCPWWGALFIIMATSVKAENKAGKVRL